MRRLTDDGQIVNNREFSKSDVYRLMLRMLWLHSRINFVDLTDELNDEKLGKSQSPKEVTDAGELRNAK